MQKSRPISAFVWLCEVGEDWISARPIETVTARRNFSQRQNTQPCLMDRPTFQLSKTKLHKAELKKHKHSICVFLQATRLNQATICQVGDAGANPHTQWRKSQVDEDWISASLYSAKDLLAISEVKRQKIECLLTKAKYGIIMSGGSRDVSVVENEIVYIHFALRVITHCYFLGLVACEVAMHAAFLMP